MPKPVLITAVVILTVIVVGLAVWFSPTSQQTTSITPSDLERNTQADIASLCAEAMATGTAVYNISCEQAVGIALSEAEGVVRKISISPVKATVPSSSGLPERRTVEMWLIDIVLSNPYFDEGLNKQVNVLQIGIRTEEHTTIYKNPLE